MAIDRNMFKHLGQIPIEFFSGPTWCFRASSSDFEYLIDPDLANHPNRAIVSAAISLSIDTEDISVEFWNGRSTIIKAGTLQAGIRYPLHIVKLNVTDTGGTVEVLVWQGESLRNFRPSTY